MNNIKMEKDIYQTKNDTKMTKIKKKTLANKNYRIFS